MPEAFFPRPLALRSLMEQCPQLHVELVEITGWEHNDPDAVKALRNNVGLPGRITIVEESRVAETYDCAMREILRSNNAMRY